MKELLVYGLMTFYICSFAGYLLEVAWVGICSKKVVNRGFLCGPVIPIYGFGSLLILFCLLRYYDDPIVIFVFGVIITSALEYFTSFIMEKIFHNRWWDYSNDRYNLNGRICLRNSFAFGVLSLVIIYAVVPVLYWIFSLLSFKTWTLLSIIFSILFVLDEIYSFVIAYNLRNRLIIVEELKNEKLAKIPVLFEKKLRESIEGFKAFPNRLLKAFPTLEKENYKGFEIMKKYKEQKKLIKKENKSNKNNKK